MAWVMTECRAVGVSSICSWRIVYWMPSVPCVFRKCVWGATFGQGSSRPCHSLLLWNLGFGLFFPSTLTFLPSPKGRKYSLAFTGDTKSLHSYALPIASLACLDFCVFGLTLECRVETLIMYNWNPLVLKEQLWNFEQKRLRARTNEDSMFLKQAGGHLNHLASLSSVSSLWRHCRQAVPQIHHRRGREISFSIRRSITQHEPKVCRQCILVKGKIARSAHCCRQRQLRLAQRLETGGNS